MEPDETISTSVTRIGNAGMSHHFIVVPTTEDGAVGHPAGGPGDYKVVFTLARPGRPLTDEYNISFEGGIQGDSHLRLPPGKAVELTVQTSAGERTFVIRPNESGFMAKVEIAAIHGENFVEAERAAYRAVAIMFSVWSMYFDVPVWVSQIDSTELATGSARVSYVTPFPAVRFASPPEGAIDSEEFRGLASVYREALNSNSPVYQFLCYFKIIEALLSRRVRLAKEAKDRNEPVPTYPSRLPETDEEAEAWLKSIFPVSRDWDVAEIQDVLRDEVRGRKFRYVIERFLRPQRVGIAHALFEEDLLTQSYDELAHIQEARGWLPLAKCIARSMLVSDFGAEFEDMRDSDDARERSSES
jgi:hypothetical protein